MARVVLRLQPDHLLAEFEDEGMREAMRGGRVVRRKPYTVKYPLSVDTCREMRSAWGKALRVEKGVGDWYRQAAKERTEQVARSSAADATLRHLPATHPELNVWLKPDQRVTAEWMANAYRNGGLLADAVGTGKTAGVIAGLIERQTVGAILVMCPKISVRRVWGKHFRQLWPQARVHLARGSRRAREKAIVAWERDYDTDRNRPNILVVVAEMLRVQGTRHKNRLTVSGYDYPALFGQVWDAVIVDESQKLLGSLDVVTATLAGEGLRNLILRADGLRLAASATPFGKGGKVEALFGTLHWLWPDEFPSKWAWLKKWFEVSEEKVHVRGGRGATKTVMRVGELLPGKTMEEFWESFGPRILRRTMEEVSPDHRGLQNWIEVTCEMGGRQAKQYETWTRDAELALEGGMITALGALDFMTRSRQIANGVVRMDRGKLRYTGESAKIDVLMAHLESIGVLNQATETKVVIASQWNEFLSVVAGALNEAGCPFWMMTGSTSEQAREHMMASFQGDDAWDKATFNGPDATCPGCHAHFGKWHAAKCDNRRAPQVFILNSQAGGVSITLDAAEELHQLDEMYPPEANEQLYGRIFRRGRVHEVRYYLYRSEGTIDEQVGYRVGERHAKQLQLLDGRRGMDYVRELAAYRKPEE